jgi:hypothetical protein
MGIEVEGTQALIVKLSRLGKPQLLLTPMLASLKILRQEASRFPPQPSRTRSRHFNTWVREVGQYSMGAFFTGRTGRRRKRPNTSGGYLIRASEKMLQQWREAAPLVVASETMVTGEIGNAASYAPWVQGDETQLYYHTWTGWKTLEQIQNEQNERITRQFQDAIDREMEREGG